MTLVPPVDKATCHEKSHYYLQALTQAHQYTNSLQFAVCSVYCPVRHYAIAYSSNNAGDFAARPVITHCYRIYRTVYISQFQLQFISVTGFIPQGTCSLAQRKVPDYDSFHMM